MSALAAFAGATGVLAAVLLAVVIRLRRRLELVARASHELRGPATALSLTVAAMRREPGGRRRVIVLESQLDRMRAGLEDLESARAGRRAAACPALLGLHGLVREAALSWTPSARDAGRRLGMTWEGPPVAVRADRGRLAQALGNLIANAVEHGSGAVQLRGRRAGRSVLVEVRDAGAPGRADPRGGADRGRGLAIAREAVEEAGGRLLLERGQQGTTAAIELPVADP